MAGRGCKLQTVRSQPSFVSDLAAHRDSNRAQGNDESDSQGNVAAWEGPLLVRWGFRIRNSCGLNRRADIVGRRPHTRRRNTAGGHRFHARLFGPRYDLGTRITRAGSLMSTLGEFTALTSMLGRTRHAQRGNREQRCREQHNGFDAESYHDRILAPSEPAVKAHRGCYLPETIGLTAGNLQWQPRDRRQFRRLSANSARLDRWL